MKYKQRTCSLHRSLGLLRSLLLLMVMTMWTSSGWADVIDATLEETAASCVGNSTSAITNTHNTAAEHFNNYNGNNAWSGQAYMKFSFEIPSGHTVTSAILTFNTHQGGRKGDRNNTVYHVTAADFDFTAFDGADRVSIPTNTTIGTVVTNDQGTAKDFLNLTMNVTNAVLTQVAAEKNYIILMLSNHGQSADLYGKGSTDKAPTLVITTANASSTTSYTILCKYGDTEIGRYEHTGFVIGESFTASADEMAAITKDNVKYIYESGNTTQKAVANAESNVITLTYREAATYNYTITTSLGETLKEESDFEGNSVTYYWPYYQVSEGTLYKGPKNSSNPWFGKTFTLDENNKAETVSYTATETTGIVFLKEAEAIETLTPATNGNIQIRCAGGYGAYGTNAKITTLTPGHYKVTGACYSNKDTKFTFNIGEVTVLEFNGNGGWGEFPGEEFMLPGEADLTFTGGSANYALDFVYIQKTADLTAEEITEIEAQATNKQTLKDKIQEAEAIDTTGKNGADDLADAITDAKAVKDAESKTAAEYAAATQALQDAIDAFNAANPATPVATWRDIKIDLTNGNLLEDSEKEEWGNIAAFGIAVAEDGTVSRVAADAANAACVVSGKWHSASCWASVNVTVNVEGPVKVTSGTQPWSDSPTTVKVGDETVASFSNKGTLWTSSATGNVVSGYYRGTEAATLTIDGGGYPTYIAIEAVDPADLPAEVTEYTVTFDKATSGAEGIAPEAQKVEAGSKATIPANTSLYIEGQTLTAWTDGENQYKAGDEVTVNADITLTPVFTENAIAFSDRTEPVTITWDATKKTGGAPAIGIEGNTGFIVAQAVIGENTIDVKAIIDATSGKFNNSNGEWIQINNGTKITLPAYKGAEYTVYSMGDSGDATFNGENGTYASNNTTYTYNGDAETMEIVIGTGSWFKTFTAVYPAPAAPVVTHTWDFTQWSDETVANLKAEAAKTTIEDDPDNAGYTKCTNNDALWSDHEKVNNTNNYTASHDNCFWYIGGEATPTANGKAIEELKGLEFNTTYGAARSLAIAVNYGTVMGTYAGGSYLWLGSKNQNCFTIKNVKAGTELTMAVESHKLTSGQEDPRGVKLYAGEVADANVIGEAFTPTTLDTKTWTVPGEEGQLVDVVVMNTNGCHIYYIDAEIGEPVLAAVNVSYSLEGLENVKGVLTAEGGEYTEGDKLTLPAKNYNLYKEGYTMTGWTDGENNYEMGAEITLPAEDVTLKPVFTENTVSLSDRTEAVTLNFDLEPATSTVNIAEGQTGVVVTQATVKSKTIDVAMKVDNTYGEGNGKLVNAGRESWCQANANTKMTVPSAKNATVEMKGYGNFSTTTVDGQTDYEGTGTATITATVASSTETVDIILGSDCRYLSYVKVTLPAIEQQGDVVSYDNEAATITWAMGVAESEATAVAAPEDAFSLTGINHGSKLENTGKSDAKVTSYNGVTYTNYQPTAAADGSSGFEVIWNVKPAAGLTFTLTGVSAGNYRNGTDGGNVKYVIRKKDGTETELGTIVPGRNATGKDNPNYTFSKTGLNLSFDDEFALVAYIGNLGNTKQIGFANVVLTGTVDGTIENVAKYTLTTATNIEEAGSVSVYPVSAEYEEGSEVKLTATENFGYDFVNWTDADNQVVSENPVLTYTMNANATLTANFKAVETYELALTIAGGANNYMVQLAPAPTVVEDKLMYEAGTAVTMTASSNSILTFTGWDGDVTGTLLENTVTMNADKAVTANFSCKDYIVAWDFVKAGNNGRLADYASKEENASAALVLRQEDGTTNSWLDKSLASQAAGYDGFAPNGAAVNWKAFADKYYFQTKVNASEFVNIKVLSKMQYQASAYKKQLLQYSLDGTEWTTLGNCTFAAIKTAYDLNGELPETANHAESLYLRWIPDYTSEALGSGNDGTAIGQIYILGDMAAVDDGQAPALVTSVPTNEATGISAAGNIVLTFSEKVKLTDGATATLGGKTLEGIVSNTTIMFPYKGLDYDQPYTFALAKECVEDLYGNMPTEDITIDFTTMVRPSVTKGAYDAVVSDGEELKAAISEANSRSDKTTRYRIFLKKGEYVLPLATTTRDYSQDVWDGVTKDSNNKPVTEKQKFTLPDATTYITAGNISFIGEDRDQTVITNGIEMTDNLTYRSAYTEVTSKYEGIGQSDVLQIKANGLYFQDVTVKTAIGDKHGRDIAIHDYGTQNIYKNVNMHGYQDTWVSDKTDGKYYVEGGIIRGRTDFICGSGDMFINGTDIIMCENGGYVVAPRSNEKYGYVFKDCTLKGSASDVNGNYWLGRAWTADAETYFINTTMEAQPRGAAWKEWNNGPTRFAEYNSKTAAGAAIDLSSRATIINGSANNPVLTDAEAMEIGNMANTFGEWQPQLDTEQAPVPTNVMLTDATLTWTDSNYALLWAIVKDGKVVDFTTEPTYTVTEEGTYAVRAANEMGGLSEASEGVEFTAIADVINSIDKAKAGKTIYNLQGVRVKKAQKGLYIINGKKTLVK